MNLAPCLTLLLSLLAASCVSATRCRDLLTTTDAVSGRNRLALEKAVVAAPGDLTLRLALAQCYVAAEEYTRARECLAQVPPDDRTAITSVLRLTLTEDDVERVVIAKQVLALDSGNVDAALTIARSLSADGQPGGALEVLHNLHQKRPFTVETSLEASLNCAVLGDISAATAWAEAALLRDIEQRWTASSPIWHWLAELYSVVPGYSAVAERYWVRAGSDSDVRFTHWAARLPSLQGQAAVLTPIDERYDSGINFEEGVCPPTVKSVTQGSLAVVAGIEPGDVLMAIGDRTIGSQADLDVIMATTGPGVRLVFSIERDGEPLLLEVEARSRWQLVEDAIDTLSTTLFLGSVVVTTDLFDKLDQAQDRIGLRGSHLQMLMCDLYIERGGQAAGNVETFLLAYLEEYPEDDRAQLALARAQVAVGKVTEARTTLAPIVAKNPARGDCEALIGLAALANKKLESAERSLQRAVLLGSGGAPLVDLANALDAKQAEKNRMIGQAFAAGFAQGLAGGYGGSGSSYSSVQAAHDANLSSLQSQQHVQNFQSAIGR